jgi:hypothetical protein
LAPVREYTSMYERVYRAAAARAGADVVVDSSKHASLAFTLRWAEDLDLRVIHLVRDSPAVAHAWAKQVRRPEVIDAEEYMPRFSPLEVSALYTAQNVAFDLLRRYRPVLRLRYEDLVADPAATIHRIRDFAGLPSRPDATAVLDGAPVAAAHTVAGNPLRFAAGPLVVRADERWRTAMPRRRRLLVSAATLPLRLRHGYLGGGRRRAPTPTGSQETVQP